MCARWLPILMLCFGLALGAGTAAAAPRLDPLTLTVNSPNDLDDGSCDADHCSLREAMVAANANAGTDTVAFNLHNLLANPGNEAPLVGSEVAGWTEAVGNWTRANADPIPLGGLWFFAPVAGSQPTAELRQDVDVSPYATAIDAGAQRFEFSGHVRAYPQSPPDASQIRVEYLDAALAVLDTFDSGQIATSSRWQAVTDTRLAPVGTRWVRVRLTSTRYNGTNNNGYYDALSLRAVGQSGPAATGTTLAPNTVLPTLTDPVVMDGTTHPGYAGTPIVELAGANAGTDQTGLTLTAGNSTVRGLAIHTFDQDAIALLTNGGNVVEGNVVGIDPTGTTDRGNENSGILVRSANNRIGGAAPAARNVVSGNGGNGITVDTSSATGNQIQGNLVGTTLTGSAALPNGGNGIVLQNGAAGNLIGGTTGTTPGGPCTGACNVLSGNGDGTSDDGIEVTGEASDNNRIEGNLLGLDVTGTADLGNFGAGARVSAGADNNVIGGSTPTAGSAPGNVASGNGAGGIVIESSGTTGNLVQGNLVGLNAAGTATLGNTGNGVAVAGSADDNFVGGLTATPGTGLGNVISGNTDDGVEVSGYQTNSNQVLGNLVGTDPTGLLDWGNGGNGVLLSSENRYNVVGGTVPEARNLISGNNSDGVEIGGSNIAYQEVRGNWIGLNRDGNAALGNTLAGARMNGSAVGVGYGDYNTIGGSDPGEGNVISGNGTDGVVITGKSRRTTVQGNRIGTDPTGTFAIPNGANGILVNLTTTPGGIGNTLGGTSAGAGNVIAGNGGDGIELNGSLSVGNTVQGNQIGTLADGTTALPNGGHGVFVTASASSNTIGGTASGAANVVRFNGGDGVFVESGTGNAARLNVISDNGGLGIDLGADGVTANDAGDGDAGANGLQNFPTLAAATNRSGVTTIVGTLNSAPNTTFSLDFYGAGSCDPSGHGEGSAPLGTLLATTDAAGIAAFSSVFSTTVPAGEAVVATATDAANNTSEFAACLLVVAPTGGLGGTVSAASGPLAGVQVTLYQNLAASGPPVWWVVDSATTHTSGGYEFTSVGTGQYTVGFLDPTALYGREYLGDQETLASAAPVAVTDGQATTGADATLDAGGALSGHVTHEQTGAPLPAISVVAYHQDGGQWLPISSATTDAAGNYTLAGLPGGSYRVSFFDPDVAFVGEFYNDRADLASADTVAVTRGATTANIDAALAVPDEPIVIHQNGTCTVYIQPDGELLIRARRGNCNFALTTPPGLVVCPAGFTPQHVRFVFGVQFFPLTETPPGSGIFQGEISIVVSADTTAQIQWVCGGDVIIVGVGTIDRYDPSGFVTDAVTGDPVVGATVTLYQVPGWRPRNHPADLAGGSCESNLSKPAGAAWSQPAPAALGVVADPLSGLIAPAINAQKTDSAGHYGWDVARGCWYVVVEAVGYYPLVSPVVGVPPEVTDLDLTLTPTPLAVIIADFAATAMGDHILVSWETVSELNNVGFNLYRSTDPAGPGERLNASLIPSQAPGSGQGFRYEWAAETAEAGVTYFYWLEDVDTGGTLTRHGPVSAALPTAGTTVAFSYQWQDGTTDSGTWTLAADGTFADDAGRVGQWRYSAPQGRLLVQYAPGQGCEARWRGLVAADGTVQGRMACRDGSASRGAWSGAITGELPELAGELPALGVSSDE